MKKTACFLIAGGVVAVLVFGNLTGHPSAETAAKAQTGKDKDKAADKAAIQKAGQSFLKAYLAGDAKAMAAHWTENGEYYADDGAMLRGRAKIEKSYAALFAKKKPHTEAEIEITSIRFPSKDTAIEEGYFKMRTGKEAPMPANTPSCTFAKAANGSWPWVGEWPSEESRARPGMAGRHLGG